MHFLVYLTKYYSFSAETKQKKLYMCNPKILLTFTRQCMPKALGDQDKKKKSSDCLEKKATSSKATRRKGNACDL